ncbi:ABC transporter ATP-binding protein [Paenibacillus sp. Soil724D2]|uniref:ABC transporter ATP-binding protein n=1 Tax=Paenibacillus sp. (strain Soil724D2) TaxID=1736392 RepID=UPI00071446CD|nr:ABC transporter ATP-binding protein [Paenibacillus sp. Soil724D2]KRE51058.1 hypothetical protein ASG85_19060 [Paenibacillus sp. Soil724D2]
MNHAITVEGLSKSFKIYIEKPTTLKEKVLLLRKNLYKEIPIVNDVSFEINQGEMVGLIGQNGSGKSTILKLLTRIISPEKGSIKINGRVSSLLELGAGFHPDFTGIENVYMNASIFGLTKKEINKKLKEIIDFAELDEFIHNPVRTYSSGMYMRLAFATAINVEPDILLVDEVLAVGDASFQRKCLKRITELKNSGKTIVLVTHDHSIVERLCDRAIWIDSGRIQSDGLPKEVVNKYLQFLAEEDAAKEDDSINEISKDLVGNSLKVDMVPTEDGNSNSNRWGTRDFEVLSARILKENQNKTLFNPGDTLIVEMDYKQNNQSVAEPVFGIAIHTLDKIRVYGTNTIIDNLNLSKIPKVGTIRFIIENLNLVDGDYEIDIAVHDKNGLMYDYQTAIKEFRVISDIRDVGIYKIPHMWDIEGAYKL